jgi:hypothetical protein
VHGWRRVAVWVGVFVVAIGAGAFVASRSDPFPPDVDGKSATPGASPTLTTDHWMLRTTTRSAHILHVGGTCRGLWIMNAPLVATPDGTVAGTATAKLAGRVTCPFATSQVEALRIPVDIAGHIGSGAMVLVFRADSGTQPAGSTDLAGYAPALSVIRLPVDGTSASATLTTVVPDGDQGTFRSIMRARIACPSCSPSASVSPSGPTTASP